MLITSRQFYLFSGFHSLLIGLLPFFLPVLLWKQGASLAVISAFIALTGVGYIITLWCWDRLRFQQRWRTVFIFSFAIELALISTLTLADNHFFLIGLALINGAYNCFYWSTQRFMFSEITSRENSGKTFGNFQILVVILLKLGVLLGAYLIEIQGINIILLCSLITSSIALALLLPRSSTLIFDASKNTSSRLNADQRASRSKTNPNVLSTTQITSFKDSNKSKLIFLLDGPFLFLESYFWVLSLYFLSNQNVLELGLVIVSLTLLLSVLFYFIKNKIDQTNPQKVFSLAVYLYALSWILRAQLDANTHELTLYATIVVIAFLTTFFRLAFNKRFFDASRSDTPYSYIILKSYYSQLGIALFFGVSALLLSLVDGLIIEQFLITFYWLASPIALIYGLYARNLFSTNQHNDAVTPSQFLTQNRTKNRPSVTEQQVNLI